MAFLLHRRSSRSLQSNVTRFARYTEEAGSQNVLTVTEVYKLFLRIDCGCFLVIYDLWPMFLLSFTRVLLEV